MSKCETCIYRTGHSLFSGYGIKCDYASITGHARILISPEPGDACTVYVKRKRRKKNENK